MQNNVIAVLDKSELLIDHVHCCLSRNNNSDSYRSRSYNRKPETILVERYGLCHTLERLQKYSAGPQVVQFTKMQMC